MDFQSFLKITTIILSMSFPTVACTVLTSTQPRHVLDMHAIDWEKFVENDPSLQHPEPRDQDFTGWQDVHGPYVQIKVDGIEYPVAGNVKSSDVFFVDLSEDGQEEAIIRLNPGGGSGGYTGVMIYGAKDGMPALIGVLGGFKIWAEADGNFLVFKEPIYGGFESNCCPSGEAETYYRLVENRLVAVKHSFNLWSEMRELVVKHYYNTLQAKHYRSAYQWNLSPAFQAANPYSQWITEYRTTTSIAFKTSELSDGSIGVDFTKNDLTASGEVTKHWFAKWVLVATPQGWRLDSVQLEELP